MNQVNPRATSPTNQAHGASTSAGQVSTLPATQGSGLDNLSRRFPPTPNFCGFSYTQPPKKIQGAYDALNALTANTPANTSDIIADILRIAAECTKDENESSNLAMEVLRKQTANLTPEHQVKIAEIIRDSGTAPAGKQGYANEMYNLLGEKLSREAHQILLEIPEYKALCVLKAKNELAPFRGKLPNDVREIIAKKLVAQP